MGHEPHDPNCDGCRELAVTTAIQQIEQLCADAPFYDGEGRQVVVADDVMAIISTLPKPYRRREWFPCGHRNPARDMPCTRPTGHHGLHSHTGHYWDESAAPATLSSELRIDQRDRELRERKARKEGREMAERQAALNESRSEDKS